jgi:hypothetical protein
MSVNEHRPFLDNGAWIVSVRIEPHNAIGVIFLGIIAVMLIVLLMRERSVKRA